MVLRRQEIEGEKRKEEDERLKREVEKHRKEEATAVFQSLHHVHSSKILAACKTKSEWEEESDESDGWLTIHGTPYTTVDRPKTSSGGKW